MSHLFNYLDKDSDGIIDMDNLQEKITMRTPSEIEHFSKKSKFFYENKEMKAPSYKTFKKQPIENKRYSTKTVKMEKFENPVEKRFLYLKTIVEQGRMIETLKQNLALKSDFCYMKAFDLLLEGKNSNYLTLEDFTCFLPQLKNEDVFLLFKKHSNHTIMMFIS